MAAAIGAGLVAGVNLADITERTRSVESELVLASVGSGVWTIGVGAVLAAIAGFFLAGRRAG